MVLSNKKLKQKLRTAMAESLTIKEAGGTDPDINKSIDADPVNSSELQVLLQASRQKAKLAKREKRKKTQSLLGLDTEEKSIGTANNSHENKSSEEGNGGDGDEGRKEKKKKRKREGEGEGKASSEEKTGDAEAKKAMKLKKKKQKKKKKQRKNNKSKKKEIGDADAEAKEEAQVVNESQANEDTSTKVYVGGIPYYSTEDDIRSYFESCGTITEVDCVFFPDTGKFRGIAMISFKTEAAAKRALALDGADMGGFFLKIKPYEMRGVKRVPDFEPKIVAGYHRIYVGNLSWDITEDHLKKFFSDCSISSIRFGKDKETGEFRGYAHIDFADNLSLMMALKLDQQIVCGRPIKISCAVPKKEGKNHSKTMPTAVTPSEGAGNGRFSSTSASDRANDGGSSSTPANDRAKNGGSSSIPANDRAKDGGLSSIPASDVANDGGLSSVSGKIKRRKCYECGEKGHLSSACPNKQTADPTSSNPS